jgi:hypothetical protein
LEGADGYELYDDQKRAKVFTILEGTEDLAFLRPWLEGNLRTKDLKKNLKKINRYPSFRLSIVN